MKVTVQIVLQADDATDTPTVVRDVFSLDREALAPNTVGLQMTGMGVHESARPHPMPARRPLGSPAPVHSPGRTDLEVGPV
jgi:hypothetical protein